NQALRAIDILYEGDAAIYIDSSFNLRNSLDQAKTLSATIEDLRAVEAHLRQRFPARIKDEGATVPYTELRDLR
ncbi:hypothetical protein BT67DRAFT_486091, partial [Trichocladium antarcticum]